MKCFSNTIILKILLVAKMLSTILMFVFPQVLFGLLFPFGLYSPLLLGAIAYDGIPNGILILSVTLMLVFVVLLVVFSLFCIINHKWSVRFTPILMICYSIEIVSLIITLFFGNLVFRTLLGIAFNGAIIKTLWNTRRGASSTGDGCSVC